MNDKEAIERAIKDLQKILACLDSYDNAWSLQLPIGAIQDVINNLADTRVNK